MDANAAYVAINTTYTSWNNYLNGTLQIQA